MLYYSERELLRDTIFATESRSYPTLPPQFLFHPLSIHTTHKYDYQSVYQWRQSGAGEWFCRGLFWLRLKSFLTIARREEEGITCFI